MSDPRRKSCIYCGEQKVLSDEHVIADSFADFVAELNQKSTQRQTNFRTTESWGRSDASITDDSTWRPQETIGQTVIQSVCKDCNNGWMSQIVENARDAVFDLYAGIWDIDEDKVQVLARWACITAMNIDALYKDNNSINDKYRIIFRNSLRIPENLIIFLGRKSGNFDRVYSKRTFHSDFLADRYGKNADSESAITIILGQLVCHVLQVSSVYERYEDDYILEYGEYLGLVPIYPDLISRIDWRWIPILRHREVDEVINHYADIKHFSAYSGAKTVIGKMAVNEFPGYYFRK